LIRSSDRMRARSSWRSNGLVTNVRAGLDRHDSLCAVARRQHDHRQDRRVLALAEPAADGVPVEPRHHHVQQDEIRLAEGEGSLVMNAISAVRTAETLELPFAKDLWLWPVPAGPAARLALGQYTSVYSIWKFAKSPDAAQRFLADLCTDARQATAASRLFSHPSFPGACSKADLYKLAAADPNRPTGKYSVLTTVALEHTRNVGYPGTANAAVMEALIRNLVPYMFARVSLGKASAEDSVAMTAWELKRIWRKWRAAGKV
jgi:hypothetical protein